MKSFYFGFMLISIYLSFAHQLRLQSLNQFPSEKCNKHGYFYQNKCYCFSQFQGTYCDQTKVYGWYKSEDLCQSSIYRLDNLMNINPDNYHTDDDEFPRLTGDSIGNADVYSQNIATRWKRMHEISQNFSLFGNKISPKQIKQGNLGNCYFLVVLAALANIRDGELIKDIFVTKNDNYKNIYVTKWQLLGKSMFVAVDDWIPKKNYHLNKPAFSQPFDQNAFWAIIMEKAWAKIFQNYQATDAGYSAEIYEALFQASSVDISHQDKDENTLFRKIQQLLELEYPVQTQTLSEEDKFLNQQLYESYTKKLQLVPNHAYTVLSAQEVMDDYGNEYKLIQVFNPWNKEIWVNNPWGGKGLMWTQKMKKRYDVNPQDGAFYLSSFDYLEQFTQSTFSTVEEDYENIYQDVPYNEKQQQYEAQFFLYSHPEQTYITVFLNDISYRFQEQYKCKHIFQEEDNKLQIKTPRKHIEKDNQNKRFIIISYPDQGLYTVKLQITKKLNYLKYFTISLYGYSGSAKFIERNDEVKKEIEKECKNGCNGNGKCNTYNGKCECYYEYSGEDCLIKKQFQCPNDCNGNGKCELGNCYCNKGFYGFDCQPCQDKHQKCQKYFKLNYCILSKKSIKFMQNNCQKTCAEGGYKNYECYEKKY